MCNGLYMCFCCFTCAINCLSQLVLFVGNYQTFEPWAPHNGDSSYIDVFVSMMDTSIIRVGRILPPCHDAFTCCSYQHHVVACIYATAHPPRAPVWENFGASVLSPSPTENAHAITPRGRRIKNAIHKSLRVQHCLAHVYLC